MKRWILAGTAAIGCLSLSPIGAQAEIQVIDLSAIARLMSQLDQMKQTYKVDLGIFGSLLRTVDPNSVASGLLSQANPMPGAGQIQSMITGSGSFGGLSALANQFSSANTYYRPESTGPDDFSANLLTRSGNTLSGVQAMAQQSVASIENHISGLSQIQSELSSGQVKTDADIAAIQARLDAEQANLTAQDAQAQSIRTLLEAQKQQYDLQQAEAQRKSADDLLARYSNGGGTVAPDAMAQANAIPATFSSLGN